jgi:hypothetical protein
MAALAAQTATLCSSLRQTTSGDRVLAVIDQIVAGEAEHCWENRKILF